MRIVSFDGSGWNTIETTDNDVLRAQRDKDELTWFRAADLSPPELGALDGVFGLHPLAIEDIQEVRERPRVEDYPNHTFLILRVPEYDGEDIAWQQVGVFLGDDHVVTASTRPLPCLDRLQDRLQPQGLPMRVMDSAGLFHGIVDALVDEWVPFMDRLEADVDTLEDDATEEPSQELLGSIRDMRNFASRIRKVAVPMRDALDSLERPGHPHIDAETRLYLRDVADRARRMVERLDHVRESAYNAQDAWNATMANRQNQDMRRLTVLFALFLVPTLIASIGGVNFARGFPDWGFWPVTVVIMGVFAVGLLVSMWKKWL